MAVAGFRSDPASPGFGRDRRRRLALGRGPHRWGHSTELQVPRNITLLPLPPECPELNPVENIWQFMRDNWLSNRVFKSYEDIFDHCCYAWNRLTWKIMSIGTQ
jgi:transposase